MTVYVRTAIANPVIALTASATLRDSKPRRQASSTNDTASVHSMATMQTEDQDVEEAEEEVDVAKMDEIDLLGGLAVDALPASRLGPSLREDLCIPNPTPSTSRMASVYTPTPRFLSSGQTLRKSYRRVLSLSPGLRVRMRTLFLPQLLPPGNSDVGVDDSDDDGERRIVLCVEVENGADASDLAFEIEGVTVDVGGKGAKAVAEMVCQPGQEPTLPLTPRTPMTPKTPMTPRTSSAAYAAGVFPLHVAALEQYNLLYVVTIASSPGGTERVKGDEMRPVSIVLSGRPFQRSGGQEIFPTATFQTRWNCTLDLTMYYASLPPAPPAPPTHGAAPRHAQHRISKPAPPTPNAIAGDKRYSLATLLADSAIPQPANRRYVSNSGRQPTMPSQMGGARVVSARGPPSGGHVPGDGRGLLVSVKLLPPGAAATVAPAQQSDADSSCRTIRPLDTFSIEIFVHNRTDAVRRFRLGIPGRQPFDARIKDIWSRRRHRSADEAAQGVDDQREWMSETV